MILLDWPRTSKKCDNHFSEINIRSVSAGIASGNGVSSMQRIMTHLNLPVLVAPCSYNKILNNIAQSSIEIAGESIDKAIRNFISVCRNDDENNEIYLENYRSVVKNYSCCSNNWWDMAAKAIWLQLIVRGVEALRKRPLAKKYSTMERLCMWPISGSEFVDVTYLIT